MAWVELSYGRTAEVTVHTDGKITWTPHTQRTLYNPQFVQLFHDAESNKIGLRRVGWCCCCLQVILDDDEYKIESQHRLTAAGISVVENHTAELQEPAPPGAPGDLGDSGIYWIDLP